VKVPEFVVIKRGVVHGIYPTWDDAARATQAMPLCSTVEISEAPLRVLDAFMARPGEAVH
jgi:hypothetical protein